METDDRISHYWVLPRLVRSVASFFNLILSPSLLFSSLVSHPTFHLRATFFLGENDGMRVDHSYRITWFRVEHGGGKGELLFFFLFIFIIDLVG